ncbi:response regulator transcription factor [soil metagenome]
MRIVIGEDSVLLREGLVRLLTDADHEVPATTDEPAALVHAVVAHQPDLAVIDVRMPPTFTDEGLRAALEIRQRCPDVAIMVLSQYVEERYAVDLIGDDVRAVGYLLKDRVADVTEFIDALRRVADGGTAIDPEVVRQLLSRRRDQTALDRLTAREADVLQLMAEGRDNTAIAAVLGTGMGTVEKHIGNVLTKLDLPPDTGGHRRVLAVLAYLRSR